MDWPVFRPSMIRLIADARARLVAAGAQMQDIYVGDRAVSGLGKNYMTEASRLEGIATYTLHLRRYDRTAGPFRLDFLAAFVCNADERYMATSPAPQVIRRE